MKQVMKKVALQHVWLGPLSGKYSIPRIVGNKEWTGSSSGTMSDGVGYGYGYNWHGVVT